MSFFVYCGDIDLLHPGHRCFSKPEVFFNGEPLQLARWPNINRSTSYWEWATVASVPDPSKSFTLEGKDSGARHPVSAARLKNWSQEQDLWFHGCEYTLG